MMHNNDNIYSNREKDNLILLILSMIWIVLPVPTMIMIILSLFKSNLFIRHKRYLFIVISLTFGLIAFTQKSISDTDISRYYSMFKPFESEIIPLYRLSDSYIDNLYYIFNPASIVLVNIFHNVQYFSLFWVSLVYFFFLLSISGYIKFRTIQLTRREWLLILLMSLFGFILFTQVTETIKQAVAMSIFGYAITLYCLKKKILSLIWVVVAVGIHSSVLLFLPLFLFKHIKSTFIMILSITSVILSQINIFELLFNLIPSVGPLILISTKVGEYLDPASQVASSLLRYDLIIFITLSEYLILRLFSNLRNNNVINIIAIFICIVFSAHFMTQNYTRFVNMGYFVYTIAFIECIKARYKITHFKKAFLSIIASAFIIANLHMSYYRIIGGQYRSSYYDNDLVCIILSSVPKYLSYKI